MALEVLEEQEDVTFVHDLLVEFQQKTGSKLARRLLDNWVEERKNFIKVECVSIYI